MVHSSVRIPALSALVALMFVLSGCPPTAPCADEGGDSDGDGVCDDADVCEDGDDELDADEDGVADACDVCPDDAADDSDGDGSCDSDDLCEGDDGTFDLDGDGVCNDTDTDDDGDGCPDTDDVNPTAPGQDGDGDGVSDHCDVCSGDDAAGDTDGDGNCDDVDVDDDGDGCADAVDEAPLVASDDADGDGVPDDCELCDGDDASGDNDGDGVCDDADLDDDNDGCEDIVDSDPDIVGSDTDGDGVSDDCDDCFGDDATGDTDDDGTCDGADFDDDGDGCLDGVDAEPLIFSGDVDGDGLADDCDLCQGNNITGDLDGDGLCNNLDPDDDGDGCLDAVDVDPLVPDTNDSDGDGVADPCDVCLGDDASGDTDGDGDCDDIDTDDDGDGCEDTIDADVTTPSVDEDGDGVAEDCDSCLGDDAEGDTDGDGECDDVDTDDDEDGCADDVDGSPLIPGVDVDGDGVAEDCDICLGDDATGDIDGDEECADVDVDDDGDGCEDTDDPAPDVASTDEDGDGVVEDCDVCLGDDAEGDTDGDGTCDDVDTDDDDDGCLDGDDGAPLVASGDTDGDTVPDDCDACPLDDPDDTDGDSICDTDDLCLGDNAAGDADADGICDGDEPAGPVTNFTGVLVGPDVELTWDNPDSPFLEEVVVVRQMAMCIDGVPVDGAEYGVGDSLGSSGEVVFVGLAEAFTDVAPEHGIAFYTAFTKDMGGNYSARAFTDVLIPHPSQIGVLSVDLSSGNVTVTGQPGDMVLFGSATWTSGSEELSVDVSATSLVQRYLFNPQLALVGVSDGDFVGHDGLRPSTGEPFWRLSDAAWVPGTSEGAVLDFTGVDGSVDPVVVTVRIVDGKTAWTGAGWDDGVDANAIDGTGWIADVSSDPFGYPESGFGDSLFFKGMRSPDGRFAYFGNRNNGVVTAIDTASNAATSTASLVSHTNSAGSAVGMVDGVLVTRDCQAIYAVVNDGVHARSNAGGDGIPPTISLVRLDRLTLVEEARVDLVVSGAGFGRDVALSEDGSTLAVAIRDIGAVFVVDAATMTILDADPAAGGDQPYDLNGFDDDVTLVALAPDGSAVFAALKSGDIVGIDRATGFMLSVPLAGDSLPGDLAVGPDGKLYYGGKDGAGLQVIDSLGGITTPLPPTSGVRAFEFSRDGSLLYVAILAGEGEGGDDDDEFPSLLDPSAAGIEIIDVATGAVIDSVEIDGLQFGHSFTVSPF